MIRTLMASTAIAALLTTGAIAQTQPAKPNETTQAQSTTQGVQTQQKQGEDLASTWIGQTVYSSAGPDAEEVGDVDDLLVDENGNITAAIIGVGGFLGLGEKEVALDYDQFQVTQDQNGEMRLVVDATEEELKNAPEFQAKDDQRSYAQMQKEGGTAKSESSTTGASTTASSDGAASGSMTNDQSKQTAASTTTTTDSAMSGQDRQTAFAQPEQGETRLSEWLGREVYSSVSSQDATGERQQQAMQNNADSGQARGSMGKTNTMASGEPVTNMQDRVKTDASGQTTAMGTSGTTSGDNANQKMATNRPASATGESATGNNAGQNNQLAANPADQQQSVGEINDVILADNGKIDSIVIDVGGFLGVGEKPVAIKFDQVEMAKAPNEDEPRLTIPMTRAELENAPKWDMSGREGNVASNSSDMSGDTTGSQTAQNSQSDTTKTGTTDGTGSMTTASRDQNDMGSSKSVPGGAQPSGLSAEDIMGATVYGSNDESVGDIDDVIVGQNGDVRAVIIDVGGFLGIGEKPVAVEYDTLNIQKDSNGETRYSINATENQLEDAPEYEKAQ
ncbi:sporulation protein YlmC with PRC-barrel domain [Rhodopseudomonas julia]|uniref:Sporulation protein YlmC with PRC-barrel domain n=1 Tax=Rhodopseudomonas julia TaxID=200617 RepID=A0ABU0C8L0_9BRAD|nr:PRC-barrel domain-containing protein [Rhodopseudomonas julia]MDQ0326862.1 sporulation protein YlmC with PRC-barrel domain [Rhodopseudomonas julia]